MPDWDKILAQVAAVTAAPIPFLVAVLIVGGLIWWLVNWSYSAVLSHKDAEIKLLERYKNLHSEPADKLTLKDDYPPLRGSGKSEACNPIRQSGCWVYSQQRMYSLPPTWPSEST
jgi:hypothetical protein